MGRHDYLTRLALGRSALRDLETFPEQPRATGTEDAIETGDPSIPLQQYDAKGRPTSAAADKLNGDLRHAQNEVLELVNVVERKLSNSEAEAELRQLQDKQREKHRKASESLDELFCEALVALTWYPETLLHRYLCGVYDTTAPFAQVVAVDFNSALTGTWDNAEGIFLPGMVYMGLATLTIALPDMADLSAFLIGLRRHGTKKWPPATTTTRMVCQAIAIAAQACLMPMQYLAVAARLGLVRPTGTKASLRTLASFYSACYTASGTAIIVAATGAHYLARRYDFVQLLDVAAMPANFIWYHAAFSHQRCSHLPSGIEIPRAEHSKSSKRQQPLENKLGWRNVLHNAARRIVHLPIEFLALQMSARVFNLIVFGMPSKQSAISLPMIGLLELRTMQRGAYLQAIGKVGLALGISLGCDAALCCIFTSWKQKCIIDFSDESTQSPAGN